MSMKAKPSTTLSSSAPPASRRPSRCESSVTCRRFHWNPLWHRNVSPGAPALGLTAVARRARQLPAPSPNAPCYFQGSDHKVRLLLISPE